MSSQAINWFKQKAYMQIKIKSCNIVIVYLYSWFLFADESFHNVEQITSLIYSDMLRAQNYSEQKSIFNSHQET